MINQIVESIDPLAVLIVLNATYFKGAWTEKFNERVTKDHDFHISRGETIQTPMMKMTGYLEYAETDDVQSISLPYGDERASMYVLLPKKHSDLNQFVKTTQSKSWSEQFVSQFTEQKVLVKMPIFGIENEIELEELLSTMGMEIAFDMAEADFKGMLSGSPENPDVYISSIKHKAIIKVNEEGTEAAAITVIEVAGCVAVIEFKKITEMIIDRPFLYFIRDNKSGLILFIGTIVNPSSGMDPDEIRSTGQG